MSLPKSKYSQPKHTPGKEFTLNGKNYIGWYVITYQGKYFAGKDIQRHSKQIYPVQVQTSQTGPIFIEQTPVPTAQDRKAGVWKRYFVQKIANQRIAEVTQERFRTFENTSGYRRVSIDWVIKGPAANVQKGDYIYYGADFKNRQTISKLEPTIKGIANFIKDYSEFVE